MLDYLEVKKFHAKKLAEDAEGGGRVESAFYHTMKMVYLKGVEDGQKETQRLFGVASHVGIVDHKPGASAGDMVAAYQIPILTGE